MVPNGWQYAEAGISKLQLIKPLQFLVNVQNLKLPTSPGLRILRVMCWAFFIYNHLGVYKELIFVFSGTAISRVSERDGLEGLLSKLWTCVGLCGLLNVPYKSREGD